MTLTFIIIFLVSLIAIAGMLYFRVYQIRAGKVQLENTPRVEWPYGNISLLQKKLIQYSKQSGHQTILLVLKAWIKFSYFIKRKTKAVQNKLEAILENRAAKENGSVSQFLQNVSEYKQKLREMREIEEKKDK